MKVRHRMNDAKKGQRAYVGACHITVGYVEGEIAAALEEHTLASRVPGSNHPPRAGDTSSRAKLAASGVGEGCVGAMAKAIGSKADKGIHQRICEPIDIDEARLTRRITGRIVSGLIADFASGNRYDFKIFDARLCGLRCGLRRLTPRPTCSSRASPSCRRRETPTHHPCASGLPSQAARLCSM